MNDWRVRKEADIKLMTKLAQVLVGATIESAKVQGHQEDCDGVNQLVLETTKGTFIIEGSYGGYTGHSCDEYFEVISIKEPKS